MSYEYTVASKDETRYSFIQTYFESVGTDMAKMTVTGLTSNCCIKILKIGDYVVVNDVKYSFMHDYTSMNHDTFVDILNSLIVESGVVCILDFCNRIVLHGGSEFILNDASYNVRLLMGLKPFGELNVSGLDYIIGTVGFMLSTPVLYLTCNIGQKCYKNMNSDGIQSMQIVMRINNSFSANYPINANNGEFSVYISSNDLSGVEFTLVDANMVEINLLSPMYLSVNVKSGGYNEELMSLSNGVAGNMIWSERMKNKNEQLREAELKRFDVISTLDYETVKRLSARNLI